MRFFSVKYMCLLPVLCSLTYARSAFLLAMIFFPDVACHCFPHEQPDLLILGRPARDGYGVFVSKYENKFRIWIQSGRLRLPACTASQPF